MFQGSKKGVRGVTWWFKTIKTIILTWYRARVKISINVFFDKSEFFFNLFNAQNFGDFNAYFHTSILVISTLVNLDFEV